MDSNLIFSKHYNLAPGWPTRRPQNPLALRLVWALALWALLLAGPAPAANQPQKPPKPVQTVGRVAFAGFDALPVDQLAPRLETKGAEGLVGAKAPPYDPEAVKRDQGLLEKLFRRYGYYQAKVTAETAPGQAPGRLVVTFRARQGPSTKVSSIRFEFITPEARQAWHKPLAGKLAVKIGDRLLISRHEDSKKAMAAYLSNHAHPLARIEGKVFVHQDRHAAGIVYLINPGPRLLFGRVIVVGNKRVAERIILRDKSFARGEPFSLEDLQETRRVLFNTGFFRTVTVRPLFRQRQGEQVPVEIKVVEQKAHSLRLGLGYGTEDEARFRIRWLYRNPLGLGDTLTVEGKLSAIYEGIEGRLKIPYLFNRRSNALIVAGSFQPSYEAYESRHHLITPTISYKFPNNFSAFLGYNLEDAEVIKLHTKVSDPEYETRTFFISSLKGGAIFDTRDDPLNPTRGTYIALRVELASQLLGGDLGFIRPELDVRHIFPLTRFGKGWLLALRAKAAFVETTLENERVPMIRRFFPGGSTSMRGYPYQKLGPLDASGNPKGGDTMAEGSVELRFPLAGSLGGVLFFDVGNAWDNFDQQISDLETDLLRYALGFGLRYQTPVGPVRLDIGFPLNLPSDSPLDWWQFFLSVGQAF